MQFFGVKEGVKWKFFPNPSIEWSENGLREEGDLLEGKSAYGYPPLPPPCPRIPVLVSTPYIYGYTKFAQKGNSESLEKTRK